MQPDVLFCMSMRKKNKKTPKIAIYHDNYMYSRFTVNDYHLFSLQNCHKHTGFKQSPPFNDI